MRAWRRCEACHVYSRGNARAESCSLVRHALATLFRSGAHARVFTGHKPFARHIVIAAQPATHTPSTEPGALLAEQYRNPLRYSYPEEVLKHRFAPYGSATIGSPITDDSGGTETIVNVAEDVDVAEVAVPAQEGKEKKNKKRKGEKEHVEGKKPKKAKVAGA